MQAGLPPELFWTAVCVGVAIGVAIGMTIQVFFAMTVNRALKEVAERNREISTGAVWATVVLVQIPIVGSIWLIYLVSHVTASLRREFADRGWDTAAEGFGRTPGLLWAWGGLLYIPVNALELYLQFSGDLATASLLSVISLPIVIGLFACFILFWVQMYQYGTRLRDDGRGYARGSLEEDYDEQYRRPRDDDEEYRTGDDDQPRRPRREEDDDLDDRHDRPRREDV